MTDDERRMAAELLAEFDEPDQRLLTLRFGLDGTGPRTLDAVGVELGWDPASVRAREVALLQRVRAALRRP